MYDLCIMICLFSSETLRSSVTILRNANNSSKIGNQAFIIAIQQIKYIAPEVTHTHTNWTSHLFSSFYHKNQKVRCYHIRYRKFKKKREKLKMDSLVLFLKTWEKCRFRGKKRTWKEENNKDMKIWSETRILKLFYFGCLFLNK